MLYVTFWVIFKHSDGIGIFQNYKSHEELLFATCDKQTFYPNENTKKSFFPIFIPDLNM